MKKYLLVLCLIAAPVSSQNTAYAQTSNTPHLPRVYLDTTYAPPGGPVRFVPAGGNLQAAINAANPGDTITLQAGATFTGSFTLPTKSGSSYIYILPSHRTRAPPLHAHRSSTPR